MVVRMRWLTACICLTSAVASSWGCAPGGDEVDGKGLGSGTAGDGSGADGSGASGNGSGGVGGSGAASGAGGGFQEGGGRGGSNSGGASCVSQSQAAEQTTIVTEIETEVTEPVAIYLMLDRSSSMVGAGGGNPESWSHASGAIEAFVNDPNSAGIRVAIGYFPPLANNHQCDGSTCRPPDVDMGELPENADAIIASLESATPTYSNPTLYTPTECALRGMTSFCQEYQEQTGVKCIAVLVSDGAPTRCSEDTNTLAGIAATALADHGVVSFTLGMEGAEFGLLNAVAEAGGSDCTGPGDEEYACNVEAGQDAFLAALDAIRETVITTDVQTEVISTVIDCEWVIPPPPEGQSFDRDKVNVKFTQSDWVTSLGRVSSAEECAQVAGGWYYDNPENPERVHVCPQTCNVIKVAEGGRIDVEFGCATISAIPH
jgi:hypothetical protein